MATTLSRMMKKAASSSLNPLLECRRTPHRIYTSAIFTTPLKTSTISNPNLFRTTLIPSHHHFSAQANEIPNSYDHLFRAIKSELEEVLKAPKDFPFKIEDNAWQEDTIALTREYQGEQIKVKVEGPRKHDNYPNGYVVLTVKVSKSSAPTLEFRVIAEPDRKLRFCYLKVKKANDVFFTCKMTSPSFWNSDEKLKKPFLKYLEVRGIEPSIVEFLNRYMLHRNCIGWLDNLKNSNISFA